MPLRPDEQLSVRRSTVRTRVLMILHARGRMHASHLAEVAGVDRRRLTWAMHGYPGRYRESLGLVRMGLVGEIRVGRAVEHFLTRSGRGLAAALLRERRQREHG